MKVILIGAGGHARVILDTLLEEGLHEIIGLVDDNPELLGKEVFGVQIIDSTHHLDRWLDRAKGVIVGIGDNHIRSLKFRDALNRGFEAVRAVHPSAVIGRQASLGPGTAVFANAVLQNRVMLGANVINTAATVDHDCVIGDHVHLAPGVHLAGQVAVEEGALLGIGAVAIPGVRIGAWSIVGAGSVVVRDIPPRTVAFGAPARVQRYRDSNP